LLQPLTANVAVAQAQLYFIGEAGAVGKSIELEAGPAHLKTIIPLVAAGVFVAGIQQLKSCAEFEAEGGVGRNKLQALAKFRVINTLCLGGAKQQTGKEHKAYPCQLLLHESF